MLAHYRAALKTGEKNPSAYLEMGDAILDQRDPALYPISLACYRKSLQLQPENPIVYLKLGKIYRRLGQQAEAVAALYTTLQLDPGSIEAHFSLLDNLCPMLYASQEEIFAVRSSYERQLNNLIESIDLHDPQVVERAAKAVGTYPFYLAYQGLNDIDLQRRYGQLICQIQAAKYPQWSQPLPPPPLKRGERLRIGIVSGFFHSHATWNFPTRGWLEAVDRKRFDLYGYYTGRLSDPCTDFARHSFTHFVENDFSFTSLCGRILADNLHALIYPEIGMNRMVVRLSALRLAPVQCNFWGHSTTSGLPTMDYFIGSDLMEPADAAGHYTETLIRLPNLSVNYIAPEIPPGILERTDLGLGRAACSVFMHPEFD